MKRAGSPEAPADTAKVIKTEDLGVQLVSQEAATTQMIIVQTEDGITTEIPADGIVTEEGEIPVTTVISEDVTETAVDAEITGVTSDVAGVTTDVTTTENLVASELGGTVELVQDGNETITVIQTDGSGEETNAEAHLGILQPAPAYQNIIIQCMDILEPLSTLKTLLESRLSCSLNQHEFYLQDNLQLDPEKNLVEQCVQGEGLVQINVEIKSQPGSKPKINIVDILKPAEEVHVPAPAPAPSTPATKIVIPFPEDNDHVTRWIVDQAFRKEQERLKIPYDPTSWNEAHVKHWIQWGIKEFNLKGVNVDDFAITGQQLCELVHEQFIQLVPQDKGDLFWTHLELLRKCKFVAVVQQPTPRAITTVTVSTSGGNKRIQGKPRGPRIGGEGWSPGNRTGNNGQIQLWQFLLELLTEKDCREVITWVGEEGEFKLTNPEMVAQMWGARKNKPTMNYEKLSRALRYYYDGDMIAKVHGKRFVYKFVCDLKMLLGYSAGELNNLVTECADKKLQKVRETLRPGTSWRAHSQSLKQAVSAMETNLVEATVVTSI